MPFIKHISVHTTPKATLRYIMNGDKTDECKFITGINLTENLDMAYEQLEEIFENCSGERFTIKSAGSGKNRIRLHHYIQSFDAGEVTAEQAHEFGVEWAKRVFGENRQVMVCTHTNTQHIHNHFVVAVYDLDRKIWYDNKKTLKLCRDISDEIAKERNIKIIENPKKRSTVSYCEWLACQNGTSWKVKLAEDIDRIILQDNVHSIEDFKRELEKAGYDVEQKKYISAKPKYIKNRKPMMTLKLGDGYGMEEILYRIEHKDREISREQINRYIGIQREYAICLREMQISLYRHGHSVYPRKAAYGELRKSSELLTFICENNIHSVSDFENMVNSAADKADEICRKKKSLENEIDKLEKLLSVADRYLEINSKDLPTPKEMRELVELKKTYNIHISDSSDIEAYKDKLSSLKTELAETEEMYERAKLYKKEYSAHYRSFTQVMESDYDKMLRQLKERYGENMEEYGVRYDFIDTVRKMADWAEKVQRKAEREKFLKTRHNSEITL